MSKKKVLTPSEFAQIKNPVITSVHGIVFFQHNVPVHDFIGFTNQSECFKTDDDMLIMTHNKRGIDWIGGHVEKGETPIQALKREAFEEAKIKIHDDDLFLEHIIEIDNCNDVIALEKGYPPIGYQSFYTVFPHQYKLFQSGCSFADDVYGRVFVMRSEVKQVHHNPNDLIAQFV